MNSTLEKLVGFAILSISSAIAYKHLNFEVWETYAFVGGAILFFVIAVIIGKAFNIGLIPSFTVSAAITAFIMAFVSLNFCFIMILVFIGLIGIIIVILGTEEEATW
ncbi:MAG: hypothetical protein WBD09_01350 [Halobacteriota archaeon]